METATQRKATQRAASEELRAALHARNELGIDLEDQVAESFLARVQELIDVQIERGITPQANQARASVPARRDTKVLIFLLCSMVLAIPLLAIAAAAAQLAGIVVVMAGLVIMSAVFIEGGK